MTTITDRIDALVEGMPDDATIALPVSDVRRLLMLSRSALLLDAQVAADASVRQQVEAVAAKLRGSESCAAAVIEAQTCGANLLAKWAAREINRILGHTGPSGKAG